MLDALSPALRPELLRSLLTQLPLSGAVSASAVDHVCAVLDTHALLAEVVPDSAPAVDAFVERVLALSALQQARDCERSCSSSALPQRAPDSRSVPSVGRKPRRSRRAAGRDLPQQRAALLCRAHRAGWHPTAGAAPSLGTRARANCGLRRAVRCRRAHRRGGRGRAQRAPGRGGAAVEGDTAAAGRRQPPRTWLCRCRSRAARVPRCGCWKLRIRAACARGSRRNRGCGCASRRRHKRVGWGGLVRTSARRWRRPCVECLCATRAAGGSRGA